MMYTKHIIFALIAFTFCGCATWESHGISPHGDSIHIAVQPVEFTAHIGDISDIMSAPPPVDDEKAFVQQQTHMISEKLSRSLESNLLQSAYVEVVPSGPAIKLPLKDKAQAILKVELSGYGKLKRKWLALLLASGAVEGIVQGVAAATLVNNIWIGAAVALEEFGQEAFVWGGGAFLFDRYYAPVTVEAKLISTADSQVIWDDTVFISVDKKAINALPEEDRDKKELHLLLTAQKAIADITGELEQAVEDNLYPQYDLQDDYDWGM